MTDRRSPPPLFAVVPAAGVGARMGAFAAAAGVGARPTPLPATAASFDAELGIGVDLPRSSFGTEKPWRRSGDGAVAFDFEPGTRRPGVRLEPPGVPLEPSERRPPGERETRSDEEIEAGRQVLRELGSQLFSESAAGAELLGIRR